MGLIFTERGFLRRYVLRGIQMFVLGFLAAHAVFALSGGC